MSIYSGFIIIDFDEAADMEGWNYFSYMYFYFGYLVGMIYSRSQEMVLVALFT